MNFKKTIEGKMKYLMDQNENFEDLDIITKEIRNREMKMSVPKSGSSKEVVLQCGETPSIFEVTKAVLKTTQSFQRGHHLHHFQLSYL